MRATIRFRVCERASDGEACGGALICGVLWRELDSDLEVDKVYAWTGWRDLHFCQGLRMPLNNEIITECVLWNTTFREGS